MTRLIVGLGNPGSQYARNRHNIGFQVLDEIARRADASPWREQFQGAICDVRGAPSSPLAGERFRLLKPLTFMNLSGSSVRAALDFFKLTPADLIVFHDELDLKLGDVRVKTGGGNAGHNGLRSISASCGNEYRRVRLGIGHPGDKARVHGYVLGDFNTDERALVEALCGACATHLPVLLGNNGTDFAVKVRDTVA